MDNLNSVGLQMGLPTDWYNNYHTVTLEAKVIANGATQTCSSSSNCSIKPTWDYTPIFYGVSPQVLYPGQKVTYIVNPAQAPNHRLDSTFLPYIEVKVDGIQLDMRPYADPESTYPNTLRSWVKNYVPGLNQAHTRCTNSTVVGWIHGAGNAYKEELSSKTCNFDATLCYDAQVMPAISRISSAGGYTSGGQDLTITGTSLNGTVTTVLVDGETCAIKSSGINEIKCETSAKPSGASPGTYFGQHGLRHKNYAYDSTT